MVNYYYEITNDSIFLLHGWMIIIELAVGSDRVL